MKIVYKNLNTRYIELLYENSEERIFTIQNEQAFQNDPKNNTMYKKHFSEAQQDWLFQHTNIAKSIFESLDDSENVNPLENGEPDLEPFRQAVIAAKITIEACRLAIIKGPYDQQHWKMINTFLQQPTFSEIKLKKFRNYFSFQCATYNDEGDEWSKERVYMEAMKECIRAIREFEQFDIAKTTGIVADLNTGEIRKIKGFGVNSKL